MEIFTDPNHREETMMRELYNASMKGSVSILNSLIQRDPLILNKISLYPFTDTPLHIASLLGHLEFCQILLHTSPSLANEVNSDGRYPLHLASAKGHTEIVKLLSKINSEICLVRDKDEKLPLHFAAMRGRVEVIKELVNAKPDCVREITENDDGSVLHLCVRYNHLEALKLLVESVRGDYQFLSARDREGNTVLHLALRRKQIKMIKYLLSLPEISTTIKPNSAEGIQGFSDEVVPQEPDYSPSNRPLQQPHNSSITANNELQESSRWNRIENFCKTYLLNQGNWIDRKQLMVAATVIATMTFQSVVSPPGGAWQQDSTTSSYACPKYGFCEAGTAVVGYVWAPDFIKFVFLNSTSFFSSLCVVLILISGFPLDNKVIMWILSILMIAAASCMLLTYMWALGLVCPNHIYYRIKNLGYILVGIWILLVLLVGLIQMTRIVFWVRSRRSRNCSANAPVRQIQMTPTAKL